SLLSHLHSAFTAALGSIPDGWDSVEAAARALESWSGRRAVLIIDDLHTLEDSPAERTLERLIEYAPPSIAFLIGSRALPGFNLSRLRVSGSLLEIGSEDLRFRSWEVERLVLDQLPAELRWFLVRTCVLTRLTGSICDTFLDRSSSQQVLEELERRQIFTTATDDRGGYRYHEVLRSHLEQVLVDELGEVQARAAYRKAARLLEAS